MTLLERISSVLGKKVDYLPLRQRKRPPNEMVFWVDENGKRVAGVQMLNDPSQMAIVDVEDVEMLRIGRWSIRQQGYAGWKIRVGEESPVIYMHLFITNRSERGIEIDHRNRDKMDNRRGNLRDSTHQQNICNRDKQPNCTSRFKGVYWKKRDGKWGTSFKHPILKKTISLGTFDCEVEAAKKYNEVVLKFRGEFAVLNQI